MAFKALTRAHAVDDVLVIYVSNYIALSSLDFHGDSE